MLCPEVESIKLLTISLALHTDVQPITNQVHALIELISKVTAISVIVQYEATNEELITTAVAGAFLLHEPALLSLLE